MVWSSDGFADCILDDADDTFYSFDSFVMLGQGALELDGGELDVQRGDNLELGLNNILTSPCDIQTGVNPNNAWSSSQHKGSTKPHIYSKGSVVV